MKMQFCAALTALLLLAGCAPQQPESKQVAATADQPAQPAPKKQRCASSTGSRLGGDCTDSQNPDTQSNTSQTYQNALAGNSLGRPR